MTPRENLLSLLRRDGYEKAPVNFGLCPSLVDDYKTNIGSDLSYREYYNFPTRGIGGAKAKERAAIDWRSYFDVELHPDTTFECWGVAHEPGSEDAKHMTRMHHPMRKMSTLDELKAFPYPEFEVSNIDELKARVVERHANGFASVGSMQCTIWETAWYMRSMEELMMDMYTDDEKAVYHLDRVTEQACLRAAAFARAGADIIMLGDDIGTQSAIMMSEDMYRKWLKPRLAKVIQAIRAEKEDTLIFYHSCGFVTPFINDLIEIGVDVLNPAQPECMDFADLHAEFGDRVSFWGTIGTQTTMPFGTADDVSQEVTRNLEIAGDKGGLFCTPTHLLEPEVPWANIEAYVSACKNFK